MPKVDLAMVGAEAVCESGGLINFVSIRSLRLLSLKYADRVCHVIDRRIRPCDSSESDG